MANNVREEWNVNQYKVVYENGKVSINYGEAIKVGKLKTHKNNALEHSYEIELGAQTAILYVSNSRKIKPVLTVNGINCATGQVYEEVKIPGWNWVFVVLYVINFFVLIGGALGGAVWCACALFSARISADKTKTTGIKVLLCIALYMASSAVGFVVALGLAMALG